jgi:hypothetical protein
MPNPKQWLCVYDLHYPKVNWPTWKAALDFLSKNKVEGFIFGGDQFDNEEISHHTKGKPLFRERASYKKNETGFKHDIFVPLMKLLPKSTKRVWIVGNHDRFETDLVECHPELEGTVERVKTLRLVQYGWEVVELGHSYTLGKLHVIHGEILTGIGNQAGMYPSRKAVELYSASVLAGHTHAPQSFSKISPVEKAQKHMAYISPCACDVNPLYLQNRPTAWMNGVTIVEVRDDDCFNVHPCITIRGQFSYGGVTYGTKSK